MKFKDLSLLKKILFLLVVAFGLVIVFPFLLVIVPVGLLLAGICALLILPFEYPKYKRSIYCKKYKQKYYFNITSKSSYIVINYLEENKI